MQSDDSSETVKPASRHQAEIAKIIREHRFSFESVLLLFCLGRRAVKNECSHKKKTPQTTNLNKRLAAGALQRSLAEDQEGTRRKTRQAEAAGRSVWSV